MRNYKEFCNICEKVLSDKETKKKEDIVMSMKDKKSEFKKRYGDRWKNVMYATATKLAKEEKEDIDEFWNPFKKKLKSKPVEKTTKKENPNVLAYKNYKPGVLNKKTGKFTQRAHSPEEAKRYGWKPVKTSSYGPKDTTSQSYNTGKDNIQRTADGTPFTGKTTGVAVPYKYKKGEVPKGKWAGTPSKPFGSKIELTQKPQGNKTKSVSATVRDTGNFGPAGEFNKSTSFDLMRQTARDLTGNQKLSPTQYGKRTIYVRNK